VASIIGEPGVNLGRADAILKRLYYEGVPAVDKRGWMNYVALALEKARGE
jgi:hypothetical protein